MDEILNKIAERTATIYDIEKYFDLSIDRSGLALESAMIRGGYSKIITNKVVEAFRER